ncbi:MAG: hypothetical protein JO165_13470, partial [Candidatus Eremiobacteraeota bacterium]|nr:hypothetical protein [Candidatus Eremiobacteraeota bacterium]
MAARCSVRGFRAQMKPRRVYRIFMRPKPGPLYNELMRTFALLLAATIACVQAAPAQIAPSTSVPVGNAPVVRISVRSGLVTIRTWNRNEVRVDTNGDVQVRHFDAPSVANAVHGTIPIFAGTINTPNGPMTLPAESFSIAPLPPGDHDAVDIRGLDIGNASVVVPAGTALIVAHVGRGRLALQDYHGGTFVTRIRAGMLSLQNVGGTGFAETLRGPLISTDSNFDRIRARSAAGAVVFERCTVKQIDVTTIAGNVAYDDGNFIPGLAHFESQRGSIALGVSSPDVRIDAHSGTGKVLTNFDGRADVSGTGGDRHAAVGAPHTVVTATSANGAVYLYDGSIRKHQ